MLLHSNGKEFHGEVEEGVICITVRVALIFA